MLDLVALPKHYQTKNAVLAMAYNLYFLISKTKPNKMPFVESNEPLGTAPAIVLIYGEPGVRKTSIGHTFRNPVLLDFDRGVKRSFGRKTVLSVESWQEVLDIQKSGGFNKFSTVVIDTAKAALDDYLMPHVINQDYALARNKLKAFGAIGDAFKLFVNNLRASNVDLVLIAHAKTTDDKHIIPDITGGSLNLIMRICDMCGYVRIVNNQPTISFTPTDLVMGKNCAELATLNVPDKADPLWPEFGDRMMESVKGAINSMNEAQREALAKGDQVKALINEANTPELLTAALLEVSALPDYLKIPLSHLIKEKAKDSGYVANKETKSFEISQAVAPDPKEVAKETEKAPEPVASPAPAAKKPAGPVVYDRLPTAWFAERVGERIWTNGDLVKGQDRFTGIYWIENADYAPFCSGQLQEAGYRFRDLTKAEKASILQP